MGSSSTGIIFLTQPGSLPPEAGPKLLALASIPSSATISLTDEFRNEMQRQSTMVDLPSRQPTMSSGEFLIQLFRCFLRAVAKLDSPIMRGVFHAVAEQRRLVDTISKYWNTQGGFEGESNSNEKASIVTATLNAFVEENSHAPVAGRLPPMFGPSRDRADWMDEKAIAAVWTGVFFCLPAELLTISGDEGSKEPSACQATGTEVALQKLSSLFPQDGLTDQLLVPSKLFLDLTEGCEDFGLIRAFISTLRSKCCPADGEMTAHLRGVCQCRKSKLGLGCFTAH